MSRQQRYQVRHVLWIGTKSPTPASDGGRLVAALTIAALERTGVRVDVVAPDAPGRSWAVAAVRARMTGQPATLERHASPAVRASVAKRLAVGDVDVVHVEQVHALAAAAPAVAAGVPIVLRVHNLEHQVWRDSARGGFAGIILSDEARRLARAEARAFARVAAVVALSEADATGCRALAPSARIVVVPPPMAVTPPLLGPALEGSPALVWVGSTGWGANARALTWLLSDVWPAIARTHPSAHLHVFGRAGRTRSPVAGVTCHDAPSDVSLAFAAESVLLLPLRDATGVRMRLLEAWARGIPVVATTAACAGLDARDGQNVVLADSPESFADAVARLQSAELRGAVTDEGKRTVSRTHDPATVAEQLLEVYRQA